MITATIFRESHEKDSRVSAVKTFPVLPSAGSFIKIGDRAYKVDYIMWVPEQEIDPVSVCGPEKMQPVIMLV